MSEREQVGGDSVTDAERAAEAPESRTATSAEATDLLRCPTIKVDGTPCRGWVQGGRTFCIWHDPERVEEANRIRAMGGTAHGKGRLPATPSEIPLDSKENIVDCLERVAEGVRLRTLTEKQATEIRECAKVAASLIQGEEMLEALAELEAEMKSVGKPVGEGPDVH